MLRAWPRAGERARTRRGDAGLRDMRLWHGGMANGSGRHRVMLALILTAAEADGGQRGHTGFRCAPGTEDFWRRPRALLAVPTPIEAWGPERETEEARLEQPGAVRRRASRL